MKTRIFIITALCVMLASLEMSAQAATIYCVHDDELSDSQFCLGSPLPFPSSGIDSLGPIYRNCDIEALDSDEGPGSGIFNLYAASGE